LEINYISTFVSLNLIKFTMKQTLLLFAFLCLSVAGFSQTTAPKDTVHPWTIHGQNTLLLSQSSFKNWAAGGENAFAGNVVLDYDFD